MSDLITAYPLCWPFGKPRLLFRERSRFDTSHSVVLANLKDEVARLTGTSRWGDPKLIVSTNIELRRDGFPMANRRSVADPGVAVYFDYKQKQRCFPCDKWDSVHDNMHAIAKTIEALRGIARWGSGDMQEAAFTGFTALPAPSPKQSWWQVLGVAAHCSTQDVTDAYRRARARAHPDHGGSSKRFLAVTRAYEEFYKERGLS